VSASEAAGDPISYLALEQGTEVLSSDGEPVGKVAHVLADPDEDIFDGIVIDASGLRGGHLFADATQVEEIRSRAVTLKLDADRCRSLPEPSANPAALEADRDDTVSRGSGEKLREKLRRAWDLISGKY
jgi:hypothetical protein